MVRFDRAGSRAGAQSVAVARAPEPPPAVPLLALQRSAGNAAVTALIQRCGRNGCRCREGSEEEWDKERARRAQLQRAVVPGIQRAANPMAEVAGAFASLHSVAGPSRQALTGERQRSAQLREHPAKRAIGGLAAVAEARHRAEPDRLREARTTAPDLHTIHPTALGVPDAPPSHAALEGGPVPGLPANGIPGGRVPAPPKPQVAETEHEHAGGCTDGNCACDERANAPKGPDPLETPIPEAPRGPAPPKHESALAQVHAQAGGDRRLPGVAQAVGAGELGTTEADEKARFPVSGEETLAGLRALLAGAGTPQIDVSEFRPQGGPAGKSEGPGKCEVVRKHVEAAAGELRGQGSSLLADRRRRVQTHRASREAEVRSHFGARQANAHAAAGSARADVQAEAGTKQRQKQTESETQKSQAEAHGSAQIRQAQTQGETEASALTERTHTEIETKTAEAQGRAEAEVERGKAQAAGAEAEARRSTTGIGVVDAVIDTARSAVNSLLERARRFVQDALATARRIIDDAKAWVRRKLDEARAALERLRQRVNNLIDRFVNWVKDTVRSIVDGFKRFMSWLWEWTKKIFWAIVKFVQSVVAWLVMAILVVLCFVGLGALAILWLLSWIVPVWGAAIRKWIEGKIDDLVGFIDRVLNLLGDPFTPSFDDCDPTKIAAIKPAVPNAAARGSSAASKLTGATTLDPAVETAFRREFVRPVATGTITEAMVTRARGILGAAAAGLRSDPVDFRCDKPGEPACNGVLAYTFHAKLAPFISIHICPGEFSRGPDDLEDTILHEATHKYGSTDDNAYSSGARSALSSDAALDNAASYENFARSVG